MRLSRAQYGASAGGGPAWGSSETANTEGGGAAAAGRVDDTTEAAGATRCMGGKSTLPSQDDRRDVAFDDMVTSTTEAEAGSGISSDVGADVNTGVGAVGVESTLLFDTDDAFDALRDRGLATTIAGAAAAVAIMGILFTVLVDEFEARREIDAISDVDEFEARREIDAIETLSSADKAAAGVAGCSAATGVGVVNERVEVSSPAEAKATSKAGATLR